MSAELRRNTKTSAPFADGAVNSTELRFTTAAGTSVNALPASWNGKYVEVFNESPPLLAANAAAGTAENVAVLFSFSSTQTATIGAAAAGGGGALDRGRIVAPGQRLRMELPGNPAAGAQVFFARIAANGTPNISISLVE